MSGKKQISNSLTVSTIEDGESAPYYFQEWFAWSNVESTVNATTSPFGNNTEPNPAWSTSIPENTEGLAYLWSKSIRYVWNESTRQYAAETAQYYRKTGTNGTSISPKGTVDYAYNSSSAFPPPTSSISGKKAIAKGDNRIWKCQGVAQGVYAWTPSGGTASDGFSYTVGEGNFSGSYQSTSNLTGHFVMWSDEAIDWVDLGQFKGQSGTTYYTHIAWATAVTLSDTQLPIPTGQTNRPNALEANIDGFAITPATGVNYAWMGYLINTVSSDSQVKQNYTWEKNKGDKGDKGDNAAIAFANPDKIVVSCYNNGNVKSAVSKYVTFSAKVGASAASINTITVGTRPTGVTVTQYDQNTVQISIATTATATGLAAGVTFTLGITDGTSTYQALVTIALIGSIEGGVGQRGKVGRFFYYAGTFDSTNTTKRFVINDAQAPYFDYVKDGQTRYAVYDPEEIPSGGSLPMSQMTPLSQGLPDLETTGTSWEVMTNDFTYLITEALFAAYAKLASAIFNGDWMLSQYGRPSRVITAQEKQLVYFFVQVDGQYPVSTLSTLLTDTALWDEYVGYGYSDDEIEAVADVCIWAMNAMPTASDADRYNAIETLTDTSYTLFGVEPTNLFSVFSPNIALDYLKGDAYFNKAYGNFIKPYLRITSGNIEKYRFSDTSSGIYIILPQREKNIQVEWIDSTSTEGYILLPEILEDEVGCELIITNATADQYGRTSQFYGRLLTVKSGSKDPLVDPEPNRWLINGIALDISHSAYLDIKREVDIPIYHEAHFRAVQLPEGNLTYGQRAWVCTDVKKLCKQEITTNNN